MNEQEKKSRRNIITTLINQLVATACGIVVPKILISSFGSAAYGISVSIAQFLSYITLLEGGIGGVARAKLYGPLAQGDRHAISVVYHSVKHFFYYVAAAFLLYSVALGLLYHDLAHVTVLSRAYTFCLVLVISLTTLAKYVGGLANLTLLTADQKQYVNNYISIGTTVVNTAFIIALARSGYGLLWVKLGSSLVFLIRPALYAVYVRKHYWLPKTGRDKAVLDQKWTGIGQHIAYFLHRNTDVVLLTLFSDVRLVAVYSVYNLIISSIRAIAEAVSGGMEATFGELLASGKHDKLICAYKQYKAFGGICIAVLLHRDTDRAVRAALHAGCNRCRLYSTLIRNRPDRCRGNQLSCAALCKPADCGRSDEADTVGSLWRSADQYYGILRSDAMAAAAGGSVWNIGGNSVPGTVLHGIFLPDNTAYFSEREYFRACGNIGNDVCGNICGLLLCRPFGD